MYRASPKVLLQNYLNDLAKDGLNINQGHSD